MASEAYDKALQLDTSNSRVESKLPMIKDLFGTGNKTTLAAKESAKTYAKVTNPIRPADIKTAAIDKASKESKVDALSKVEPAKNNNADITSAINNWAQAWSTKNLDQ